MMRASYRTAALLWMSALVVADPPSQKHKAEALRPTVNRQIRLSVSTAGLLARNW